MNNKENNKEYNIVIIEENRPINQSIMGGKKNKRGSIPSSYSPVLSSSAAADPEEKLTLSATEAQGQHPSIKIELVERTPENDYGVLSDPEENDQPSPVPLLSKAQPEPQPEEQQAEPSGIQTEPSQPPHVAQDSRQSSQSSPQQQPQSIQAQISQTPTLSKSMNTLQLKLSTDKSFSRKITLHTFFSYIILAIEIQRSCTASISRVSIPDVEALITYMIEHHSASEGIQKYLQTLRTTGVIKNLIEAVIEFNKDQTDAVDKLLMSEQIELEMAALKEDATATATATAATPAIPTTHDTTIQSHPASANPAPQTPQRGGFFTRMRCFWSGCCG
jgi:SOS response regulatory protein OraA/RecX